MVDLATQRLQSARVSDSVACIKAICRAHRPGRLTALRVCWIFWRKISCAGIFL